MNKWIASIDIKQHLSEDTSTESVRKAAQGVVTELKRLDRLARFEGDIWLWNIQGNFESLSEDEEPECDDFNGYLSELYDWADDNRVWLGL